MFNSQHIYSFGKIQTSQTGGQLYSDTSPYEVSECSLALFYLWAFAKAIYKKRNKGSGCGSVGKVVASDTRGLRFEYSHWQKITYIEHLFIVNCVLKRRK